MQRIDDGSKIKAEDVVKINRETIKTPYSSGLCPDCFNAGFVIVKNKSGNETAEPCKCLPNLLLREHLPESNIPARFHGWEMKDHDKSLLDTQKVFISDWIKNIGKQTQKNSLLLLGKPGSHKTSIACSIMKNLMRMDRRAYFAEVSKFIESQKATFNNGFSTEETPVERAKDAGILCIDDIGSESLTDFSIGLIWQVIDYRYSEALPTIYTSNFSAAELLKFYQGSNRGSIMGDKLVRRILGDSVIIFVQGGVKA